MVNRLVASIAMACAVVAAGSALAQDLPKQTFKVVGTWSNLTNWQQNEQPFWTKTVPEASKGQITANIQSLSELGLKGTEIVQAGEARPVRFRAWRCRSTSPRTPPSKASTSPASPRPSTMARKTVDAYAPILNATFEKKYGARALNYYIWPSQMFYCNSADQGPRRHQGQEGPRAGHLAGRSRRGARRHRRDHSVRRGRARPAARHRRLRHHRHHARLQGGLARGDARMCSTLPVGFSVSFTIVESRHLGQARRQDQGVHGRRHQGADRQVVEDHHRRGHDGPELHHRNRRVQRSASRASSSRSSPPPPTRRSSRRP